MARPRTISDQDILEAAASVFLKEGSQVSTRRIGEHVGLSEAALFKRFGTKKELLISALSPPGIPSFVLLLGDGPSPDRGLREQLEEIGMSAIAFFRQIVPRMMVLRSAGISPMVIFERYDRPPPLVAASALRDWFRRGQERGLVRDLPVEGLASSFLGALHMEVFTAHLAGCLLYTSPSPRDRG